MALEEERLLGWGTDEEGEEALLDLPISGDCNSIHQERDSEGLDLALRDDVESLLVDEVKSRDGLLVEEGNLELPSDSERGVEPGFGEEEGALVGEEEDHDSGRGTVEEEVLLAEREVEADAGEVDGLEGVEVKSYFIEGREGGGGGRREENGKVVPA